MYIDWMLHYDEREGGRERDRERFWMGDESCVVCGSEGGYEASAYHHDHVPYLLLTYLLRVSE